MPTDPFTFIAVPKELASEFFAVFARFEFALKEAGFYSFKGYLSPSWRAFAKTCNDISMEGDLAQAVHKLCTAPPQVQGDHLKWEDKPLWGDTDIHRAVDAAQRVRNNLFHGGKHPPNSPPGRDEELVRASLAVLYACLEHNSDLRDHYETTIF